jgi:hypothetical protein
MRRTAVEIDLKIHLRRAQLRDQRVHFLERRDGILRTVQDEDAALDVLGGFRREILKCAVHRDESNDRRTGFDQFNPDRAAEAVAYRSEPRRIDHRLRL